MKNHEELFLFSFFCAVMGGGLLGVGRGWLGTYFIALAANLLVYKWILIALDKRRKQRNGKIN